MGKLISIEDELILKIPNHMGNDPLCRDLSKSNSINGVRTLKPCFYETVLKRL